ncbi:hypothetical protein [Massilia luteola]|uniref:hypothetical protein n=1 Tax=Massilia luteola TaxID=3081751 RepID=UPI002ACBF511|nr:hypothetical protein [Massilia sp. Gc5]
MKRLGGGARTAVTLIVEHELADADSTARYDAWLREILPLARSFAGHWGMDIVWPGAGSTRYTLELRFEGLDQLRAWVDSPERVALTARIEPSLAQETLQVASGLEFLFTAPADVPPRRCNRFLLALLRSMARLAAGWPSRFRQPCAVRHPTARRPAG